MKSLNWFQTPTPVLATTQPAGSRWAAVRDCASRFFFLLTTIHPALAIVSGNARLFAREDCYAW